MTDIRTRLPLDLLKLLDLSIVAVSFGLAFMVVFIDEQHLLTAGLSVYPGDGVPHLLPSVHFYSVYLSRNLQGVWAVSVPQTVPPGVGATRHPRGNDGRPCLLYCDRVAFLRSNAHCVLRDCVLVCERGARELLADGFAHALARIRAHGRNLRCLLIIGTNPRAVAFARTCLSGRAWDIACLDSWTMSWLGLASFRNSNFPLVCDCKGLTEFLRRNIVDEVVVYLPFAFLPT